MQYERQLRDYLGEYLVLQKLSDNLRTWKEILIFPYR